MTGGDWIREAMCDDSLVAEALICLHHSDSPPHEKSGASDLELKWTVRQRRSKAALTRKKGGDHTRASPTTPLSWSGATSLSGGGCGGAAAPAVDGTEESSCAVKSSEAVRSKVTQTSVTATTPFKRSRKKKTLAELKDEESLLLKERKGLKNELASMRDLLKQQRARNESLKKMQAESQRNNGSFLLPDLNIPLDSNPSPEILYGTS
ncbi:hypothetical protein EUTSA_v10008783mg [Eutrema salsugineum]|uniref:Uncharacterized protein n=1 Tax=Eutrema salsugineum TaxID=72664 RepID=V4MTR2_EUTSA|nr:uncharacterized protein LOC18993301 [Eutrema salsugineum]ESQ35231.1 hypothetical protein EUTSA_v10008783mg [Eutrema salsugineum]